MKRLASETEHPAAAIDAAGLVLDTVPAVVRYIRAEMRRHREGLSIPQFRALGFLARHPGASLSDVAEHVGLMLPSASKMVDGLVERKLADRQVSTTDRRYLTLTLTPHGRDLFDSARRAAQTRLVDVLSGLTPEERETVAQAMQLLLDAFPDVRSEAYV